MQRLPERLLTFAKSDRRIDHQQHRVGPPAAAPAEVHPALFDAPRFAATVESLARGIYQAHPRPAELDLRLEHVAGGAGIDIDERALLAAQRVEQARFASVHAPHQRHLGAIAHELPVGRGERQETGLQRAHRPRALRLGPRVRLLVGEIERAFELGERAHQLGAQAAHLLLERTRVH